MLIIMPQLVGGCCVVVEDTICVSFIEESLIILWSWWDIYRLSVASYEWCGVSVFLMECY